MRLSIITPTIDSAVFIEECVASVRRDEGAEIEHIVVHDGTDAYVTALIARFPWLKILRGPGAGSTAAVRRGIEAATGDFVFWLNSDDRLLPGAIARLVVCAGERPDIMIWTGGTRIVAFAPPAPNVVVRVITDPDATALTLANVLDDLPLLTARFCRRAIFAQAGNLDPAFSECSDREFLIRVVMAGIGDAPLGVIVSELRQHEGSRTIHRRRRWVPPYFAEHLRLADLWLAKSGLPAATARLFRNWRAREALRLVVYQLRAGQWQNAMASAGAALASDPLWGLHALTTLGAWRRRRRSSKKATG